jgi:leader peptidase (prepilin peptidase)/N-methyltransferase
MLTLLLVILGLLLGGIVNWLADQLPQRAGLRRPACPRCAHVYGPAGWLGLGRRLLLRGACPQCGLPTRRRVLFVELGLMVIFGSLPFLISELPNLLINALYIAVLVLVIVTDLEHRLIFHVVTFPVTAWALVGAFLVSDNNFGLALGGAALGFGVFYAFYWFGRLVFGPGALGFGDVTLSMMMGAMLGLHRIPFALVLGIFIGGIVSLLFLVTRRAGMRTKTAYGPYLAVAGIVMLIWGLPFLDWYLG